MKIRPSDFGFETIEELRELIETSSGETVGEFSTRIAEFTEGDEFGGDRKRAAYAMLCFLSDVTGDDVIDERTQELINRFFRLLRD